MKIKFTKAYQIKGVEWHTKRHGQPCPEEGKGDSPLYTEGQVLDVPEYTARKFINRGVAEEIKEKPAPAPKAVEPVKTVAATKPADITSK